MKPNKYTVLRKEQSGNVFNSLYYIIQSGMTEIMAKSLTDDLNSRNKEEGVSFIYRPIHKGTIKTISDFSKSIESINNFKESLYTLKEILNSSFIYNNHNPYRVKPIIKIKPCTKGLI